jgi:hypothetical protein
MHHTSCVHEKCTSIAHTSLHYWCIVQEWVDFYLIGTDGGTLRGAVKVLQSQDSCLPYQYKSKHAQCFSSLSMLQL